MLEQKKHCKIKRVLDSSETEFIRGLFNTRDRKTPKGVNICEIDNSKPGGLYDCPHRFSWAFEYYCDNPEILRKNIAKKSTD